MTTCTICDGPPGGVVVVDTDRVSGETFAARRCEACGAAYTCPRPADVSPYYESGYYAFREVRLSALERTRLALIVHAPYRPVAQRPPGRMLDVGCGAGRLGGAFRRLGWKVDGIEPSAAGAQAARGTGMSVHTGTLDETLPWEAHTFDAVVFNHSLEHVSDPVGALRRVAELSKEGALVGVTVPNFASWQRSFFDADWLQLDMPRHLTHFTPHSLSEAAGHAGLHIVKMASTSMLAGFTGSMVRKTGLPLRGRSARVAALATYPLVAVSDHIVGGDCLNMVARVSRTKH